MTSPRNPRQISRRDLTTAPHLLWNAYVDLLAMSEYDDLTPRQRISHLALWYDSEVQNGGHLQYFENRQGRHVDDTVTALEELGAEGQRRALEGALSQLRSTDQTSIRTAEEFAARALEGEFSRFDDAFHEASPSITELLKNYLDLHTADFVEIVG